MQKVDLSPGTASQHIITALASSDTAVLTENRNVKTIVFDH